MKTRTLIAASTLAVLHALHAADRPNIILIMADDMGYENIACHGNKLYKTPNIDSLAAGGMRFSNAHSQPICTPSRVQIMTGIHNNRNYLQFGLLDPAATTFANILRDSGYETCIAGKWQLRGGFEGPKKFGFDNYCLWQLTRRPSRYANPGFEIDGKEVDFKNGEFGPDIVTDYICKFIETNKGTDKPFLVYYPMMLPHWPFVPTPESPDWDPTMWRDKTAEPGGYRDQKYWAGFVEYTDKMVGKVVAKLDKAGLRENTIVIFTCDNGTYTGIQHQFGERMVTGAKGNTIDDGTHVPFVANWPGKIKPGQISDELVDFSDILPTLSDLGKTPVPDKVKTDGKSIVPILTGAEHKPKESIYCWYERNGIRNKASQHARTARYKLYATGRFFDTFEDPLEENDLASSGVPGNLAELHKALKATLDIRIAETEEVDAFRSENKEREKGKGRKDIEKK